MTAHNHWPVHLHRRREAVQLTVANPIAACTRSADTHAWRGLKTPPYKRR
jgi:hypothetical protein